MILVVGATGQVGSRVVENLVAAQVPVRALVRQPSAAEGFRQLGAEVAAGDLLEPGSLDAALAGVRCVVTTANSAIPSRRNDRFGVLEREGYPNLLAAARRAGVKRWVHTSVRIPAGVALPPLFALKKQVEELLAASGLETVTLRADVFMDTAFAAMGSGIPLRGAVHAALAGSASATMLRPFPFARKFFDNVQTSIEQKGQALVPGDGQRRHAFICADDVARYLTAAALGGPAGAFDLAGPEALSYLDVVSVWSRVLGRPVKASHTPVFVFRAMGLALGPFNPAASNLMKLNVLSATTESQPEPATAAAFGLPLTTAEQFLRAKAALPA